MKVPLPVIVLLILLIGFLTSSTVFFYFKTNPIGKNKNVEQAKFDSQIPVLSGSESAKKVDELTVPATPKGRLSFPANVYTVAPKESLVVIAAKFGIDWQLIKEANGISNENLIQAGFTLVIPKLNQNSDLYRIEFKLNEDKASELNSTLRGKESDPQFDPVAVAKDIAVPYFGITSQDEFSLIEEDLSNGTALVAAKNAESSRVIGLFQPKEKGKKGIWAVLYVEKRPN